MSAILMHMHTRWDMAYDLAPILAMGGASGLQPAAQGKAIKG